MLTFSNRFFQDIQFLILRSDRAHLSSWLMIHVIGNPGVVFLPRYVTINTAFFLLSEE